MIEDCFGFYVAWLCLTLNEVWAFAIVFLFALSLVGIFKVFPLFES
jgi:hypothetical protein